MNPRNFSNVIFLLIANSNDKRLFELTVKEHGKAIRGVCARSLLYSAIGFALLIYFAPVATTHPFMGSVFLVLSVIILLLGVTHKSNTDGKKRWLIIQGALFYGVSTLNDGTSVLSAVAHILGYGAIAFLMAATLSATLMARRVFGAILDKPEYDDTYYSSYAEKLQAESADEPWFDPDNEMWFNRLSEDDEFALRQRFKEAGRLNDYFKGELVV